MPAVGRLWPSDDDGEEEEDGNNLLDLSHRLLRPVTSLHIVWFPFIPLLSQLLKKDFSSSVKMVNNMPIILGSVIPTDNSRGGREFPFPFIPKNESLGFPFPNYGNGFFHSLPDPEYW